MEKKYTKYLNKYVEEKNSGVRGHMVEDKTSNNCYIFVHNNCSKSLGWSTLGVTLMDKVTYMYGWSYTSYSFKDFKIIE